MMCSPHGLRFRLCLGLWLFAVLRFQVCRNCFFYLLDIHSVAFGSVHENVVAACGGSLMCRIQQADFQKQLAEFGLVIFTDLLGQKLLRGRGILLGLYLVPLRQSRDLDVGEMADQVNVRPPPSRRSLTERIRVGGSWPRYDGES